MIATEREIAAVMAENKRLHRMMRDQGRILECVYAALLAGKPDSAREALQSLIERSTPATSHLQSDLPRLIGKVREREKLLLETLSWLDTPGNSTQPVASRLRACLQGMGVIGG